MWRATSSAIGSQRNDSLYLSDISVGDVKGYKVKGDSHPSGPSTVAAVIITPGCLSCTQSISLGFRNQKTVSVPSETVLLAPVFYLFIFYFFLPKTNKNVNPSGHNFPSVSSTKPWIHQLGFTAWGTGYNEFINMSLLQDVGRWRPCDDSPGLI